MIMVDEITSFNKEVINLSVRFVHHNIRVDFVQYAKITKVTGSVIATSVLDGWYQLGLDVENV